METKDCSNCNMTKPITQFIKNKQCKQGYANTCKECQNRYSKTWKQKNSIRLAKRRRELYHLSNGLSSKKRIEERKRIREENKPYIMRARVMRSGLLQQKKKGIIADLEFFSVKYITKWLQTQSSCSCCSKLFDIHFKHDGKFHNNSPSLDRFYPEKGYVKGNISLLCWRCNNLKRDATVEELDQIVHWMHAWGNDPKLKLEPLENYYEQHTTDSR